MQHPKCPIHGSGLGHRSRLRDGKEWIDLFCLTGQHKVSYNDLLEEVRRAKQPPT